MSRVPTVMKNVALARNGIITRGSISRIDDCILSIISKRQKMCGGSGMCMSKAGMMKQQKRQLQMEECKVASWVRGISCGSYMKLRLTVKAFFTIMECVFMA